MNRITGEKIIQIQGKPHVLRFTWRAVAEVTKKYGDNPNLFDPEVIASVAAAGLRDRHPDMTAERIMEISPPLVPFAKDVQEALTWAYFGAEEAAASGDVKKKSPATGFWKRFKSLFSRG